MLAVRELFTVSLPEHVEQWGRDREHAACGLRRLGWWTVSVLFAAALLGVMLLDRGLPFVAGERFAAASSAMVLALLPLLSLPLLAWQAAALHLRPEAALAVLATGLVVFMATAGALTPVWGATGASAGLLAAVAASSALSAWKLPAAVTPRLLLTGVTGACSVLALATMMGLLR